MVLPGLITALSTLKTSGRIDVFEDAKRRVFRSKSFVNIALDPSTDSKAQNSK